MLHRLPLCLVNSATYWQISCSNPDSNNKKEKKGKAKKTKTYLKQIHFGGQSAKEKTVDRSKEESASKVEWLEMSITMRAAKVKWEIYRMVVRLSLMYGLGVTNKNYLWVRDKDKEGGIVGKKN